MVTGEEIAVGLAPGWQRAVARLVRPRIRLTVVGVITGNVAAIASQADFVAVIDGRRARHRHLHDRQQGQAVAAVLETIDRLTAGDAIVVKHAHRPVGVMATQEVHGRFKGRGRVVFLDGAHHVVELRGRQRIDRVVAVVVVIGPDRVTHEAEHGLAEAVVHCRVELIAQQAELGIILAPGFREEHSVGIVRLDSRAEGLEEGRVDADDVRHHVNAPAIRAASQPVGGNAVRAKPIVQHIRVCGVDLRQRLHAKPTGVVGVAGANAGARRVGRLEEEPAAIWAVEIFTSAHFGMAAKTIEEGAVRRDVVGHAIQDNVDAAAVRLRGQLAEEGQGGRVIAQNTHRRINTQIAAAVVLVVGR